MADVWGRWVLAVVVVVGAPSPVSGNRCATHSQQLYPSHSGLVGDGWASGGLEDAAAPN